MTTTSQRSPVGAMTLGGAITIVCILPVFLTGAMAVQLMEELSFGPAALGLAVASWRATAAATSPFLGRLCDRLGAIQSIRVSAVIATIYPIGIALTADSWGLLVAWLMLGGFGHALAQPAANRLLANAVTTSRLGMAFGIKQSAPPAASMIDGISVPLIAVVIGWRWAYVMAGVLAAITGLSAGRRAPRSTRVARGRTGNRLEDRKLVILLAIAFGLGTSTSAVVTTFYVDAAVGSGLTAELAGTMLAVASVTAIVVRLLCGAASDRIPKGHLQLCAGLLGLGGVGIAILTVGTPTAMTVGPLIALAGSWGFNGVFWYAMIRAFPRNPGTITGALAPGALLGSTLGPVAFGFLVDATAYRVAWTVFAGMAVVACGAMLVGDRRLPVHEPTTLP